MIRNVVLAIILLVQLGAWFIMDPPWSTAKAASESIKTQKLADIDIAEIGAFRVTAPGGSQLNLSLEDGVWVLNDVHGFPAIQEKVTKALDELSGLSRSDFRTSKSFLHEDLKVDDVAATRLQLFSRTRNPMAEILIGKRDIQGNRGTFIRMGGSDDVYVAPSQDLGTVFDTNAKQWYQPTMMDVSVTETQRMTELRTACYHIEVEMKRAKKGDDGQPLEPEQFERLRYVYERVDPAADSGDDPHWKVLEPSGKSELVLDDLMVKGIASTLLTTRANEIVGAGLMPEHGLADRDELAVRVEARFREDGGETTRVLEIGNERTLPAVGGVPRPPERFARVRHPGGDGRQSFVFAIPAQSMVYLQRDPETLVRRAPPPSPALDGNGR
ncbi:MAG: DUF4340 domain-containing protein [Planctomycetes bacterium]|nr:DUF4340 domain-containing protein [Planctomycetota bacterium]